VSDHYSDLRDEQDLAAELKRFSDNQRERAALVAPAVEALRRLVAVRRVAGHDAEAVSRWPVTGSGCVDPE